jgi:hypothetical protein
LTIRCGWITQRPQDRPFWLHQNLLHCLPPTQQYTFRFQLQSLGQDIQSSPVSHFLLKLHLDLDVGRFVGVAIGSGVGRRVGLRVGIGVGNGVGITTGVNCGEATGSDDTGDDVNTTGSSVGNGVGWGVGDGLGFQVGRVGTDPPNVIEIFARPGTVFVLMETTRITKEFGLPLNLGMVYTEPVLILESKLESEYPVPVFRVVTKT